ncbi:hypothetical protein C8J56DRAFT_1091490 [Mycena floridula]|nr:hypothetical protein C8J56DRAFT_1091490 [Mycena floridula]
MISLVILSWFSCPDTDGFLGSGLLFKGGQEGKQQWLAELLSSSKWTDSPTWREGSARDQRDRIWLLSVQSIDQSPSSLATAFLETLANEECPNVQQRQKLEKKEPHHLCHGSSITPVFLRLHKFEAARSSGEYLDEVLYTIELVSSNPFQLSFRGLDLSASQRFMKFDRVFSKTYFENAPLATSSSISTNLVHPNHVGQHLPPHTTSTLPPHRPRTHVRSHILRRHSGNSNQLALILGIVQFDAASIWEDVWGSGCGKIEEVCGTGESTLTVLTPHYKYLKQLHSIQWDNFVKDIMMLTKEADTLPFHFLGFESAAPEFTLRTHQSRFLRPLRRIITHPLLSPATAPPPSTTTSQAPHRRLSRMDSGT